MKWDIPVVLRQILLRVLNRIIWAFVTPFIIVPCFGQLVPLDFDRVTLPKKFADAEARKQLENWANWACPDYEGKNPFIKKYIAAYPYCKEVSSAAEDKLEMEICPDSIHISATMRIVYLKKSGEWAELSRNNIDALAATVEQMEKNFNHGGNQIGVSFSFSAFHALPGSIRSHTTIRGKLPLDYNDRAFNIVLLDSGHPYFEWIGLDGLLLDRSHASLTGAPKSLHESLSSILAEHPGNSGVQVFRNRILELPSVSSIIVRDYLDRINLYNLYGNGSDTFTHEATHFMLLHEDAYPEDGEVGFEKLMEFNAYQCKGPVHPLEIAISLWRQNIPLPRGLYQRYIELTDNLKPNVPTQEELIRHKKVNPWSGTSKY